MLFRSQFGVNAPLWILDEPFTALDQKTVMQLCETLNQHLQRGGMLIYTTHQEIALRTQQLLTLDLSQNSSPSQSLDESLAINLVGDQSTVC